MKSVRSTVGTGMALSFVLMQNTLALGKNTISLMLWASRKHNDFIIYGYAIVYYFKFRQ